MTNVSYYNRTKKVQVEIDLEGILSEVPISHIIQHFGTNEILAEMDPDDILEYCRMVELT